MARGRADNPGWDESEFMQWAKSKQQFTIERSTPSKSAISLGSR